jgi:hypothetical protein
MSNSSFRTEDHWEINIGEILGRISGSAADAVALRDVGRRDERVRHELAADLLADACALVYATARVRIDRMDDNDVYLRREAMEEAVATFQETIDWAARGISRLRAGERSPLDPPSNLAHAESFRGRVELLPACATLC